MRRRLGFALLLTCATVVAIAACVGDDPATPTTQTPDAATTTTPAPTTSSTVAPIVDAATAADARSSYCESEYEASDAAYLAYCADFDDPARDAGYKAYVFDSGTYVNPQSNVFYSAPNSVFINPDTSALNIERGAYLDWPISGPTDIHQVAVRAKLRPQLDTQTHTPLQGYVELVKIIIGANDGVSFRYTYGRDLANGTNGYIGYSIAGIHQNEGSSDPNDAGDAGSSKTTVIETVAALPNFDWAEVFVDVMIGSDGASVMQLTINEVLLLTQPITITPSPIGVVQVGAHAIDAIDAPAAHSIDDVRIAVFH